MKFFFSLTLDYLRQQYHVQTMAMILSRKRGMMIGHCSWRRRLIIEKSCNSVTLTKIQVTNSSHLPMLMKLRKILSRLLWSIMNHWQYQGSENLPSSETGEAWGHLTTIFGNMRTITDFNVALKRPSIRSNYERQTQKMLLWRGRKSFTLFYDQLGIKHNVAINILDRTRYHKCLIYNFALFFEVYSFYL